MKLSTRGLLAATLLPFALAVALASFWSLRSEERLQDALAMAARAGMPGRLEEVPAWLDERFGPLDPGDNGGPLVLEALDMLRGRSLSDLDWEQAAPLDLPPIDAESRATVSGLEGAVDLLRQGLAMPRFRLVQDWEEGIGRTEPPAIRFLTMSRLLEHRVVLGLEAGEGPGEPFLDDLELLVRLPETLTEEPTQVAWTLRLLLLRRSSELLRHLADRGLEPALLRDLLPDPPEANSLHLAVTEAAGACSVHDFLLADARKGSQASLPVKDLPYLGALGLLGPVLRHDLASILETQVQLYALRHLPAQEALEQAAELLRAMEPGENDPTRVLSRLVATDLGARLRTEHDALGCLEITREGLDQLIAWHESPPATSEPRTIGEGAEAWTVEPR